MKPDIKGAARYTAGLISTNPVTISAAVLQRILLDLTDQDLEKIGVASLGQAVQSLPPLFKRGDGPTRSHWGVYS